jgi:hypothetical protein
MAFRFPKGVVAPAGLSAPGRGIGRPVAAGGGGGGGTPGDVLGFSGPQTYNNDGGFNAGNIDLADRPFTFTVVFTSTDGSASQTLLSQWGSGGDRSFQFRVQSGSSFQELISTSGSNSTSGGLFAFNDFDPSGVEYTLVVDSDGVNTTVTINDVLEDTASRNNYRLSDEDMILGETFIGTIYSASLVFND